MGLAGQSLSVNGKLSGPENLAMFGRLHRLAWPVVRERSARLLDIFDLGRAGKKAVKTYSGGMRRKLDLALSLMAEPRSCSSTSPPPAWTRPAVTPCGRSSAAWWDAGRPCC